jgi:hypothetical protein
VKRHFSSPKIPNSLALINSLNYLRENLLFWNIFNSSVIKAYLAIIIATSIEEILQSLKKLEMEGLHNHHLSQDLKQNKAYLGNLYLHIKIFLYQGITSHYLQALQESLQHLHFFLIQSFRIWSKLISW